MDAKKFNVVFVVGWLLVVFLIYDLRFTIYDLCVSDFVSSQQVATSNFFGDASVILLSRF
ncbi:MAG: hypothetical protein ACYC01_07445 [Lutibacter sp.]